MKKITNALECCSSAVGLLLLCSSWASIL